MNLSFIIGITLFIFDAVSKYLTQKHLSMISFSNSTYPYGGIGIFPNFFGIEFSIIHLTNKGAAWGIFSNFQIPLLILRCVMITGLFGYLFFYNKNKSWEVPLTLIAVGALGNVADYFIYGHVVDMLHFVLWGYSFPAFNVADSAITIGVSWMIINSFFCHKEPLNGHY